MKELFQQFDTLNILIIGDVMIDSYLWGNVERISPEAPVPIVAVVKKENRLGGAANVALNIQALGATPIICSVVGEDNEGEEFIRLLRDQNISDKGILKVHHRPTTVKTRIIGSKQQILRIDLETDECISEDTTLTLFTRIEEILETTKIDAIIFEDYDKGVLTPLLIQRTIELANKKKIITVVDPKHRNFLDYKNVTLFKPNVKELREGLKVELDPRQKGDLEQAAGMLRQRIEAEQVMITLSELGVYMDSVNGKRLIPAHIRNISDVSGAGDTVIATATLCLAGGLDEFSAAAVANLAGGLVCEHVGVVPINKELLLKEASKL